MSNRTLIELNHDLCPPDRLLDVWAKQMQEYMRSGDRAELPYGVTFKHMRHHSEPCPLAGAAPQPKTWPQIKAETIEKYEDLFQEQAAKIAELESRLAGAAAIPSAQTEWISVETGKVPAHRTWVIGCVEHDGSRHSVPVYGVQSTKNSTFRWESEFPVTHWRELPSPPVPSKEPK